MRQIARFDILLILFILSEKPVWSMRTELPKQPVERNRGELSTFGVTNEE